MSRAIPVPGRHRADVPPITGETGYVGRHARWASIARRHVPRAYAGLLATAPQDVPL